MTFTTEYELMLRAIALAIVIMLWVFVRTALEQPVGHPWLGSLSAGLIAILAGCVAVVPDIGPLPVVTTSAGVVLMGLLFVAGARYEATGAPLTRPELAVLIAVAAAVGMSSYFLIPAGGERILVMRLLVSVCIAISLVWAPRLFAIGRSKTSTAVLGVFAAALVLDRTLPLVQGLGSQDPGNVFAHIERSDLIAISAGGAAMLFVSVQRARRERDPAVQSPAGIEAIMRSIAGRSNSPK